MDYIFFYFRLGSNFIDVKLLDGVFLYVGYMSKVVLLRLAVYLVIMLNPSAYCLVRFHSSAGLVGIISWIGPLHLCF